MKKQWTWLQINFAIHLRIYKLRGNTSWLYHQSNIQNTNMFLMILNQMANELEHILDMFYKPPPSFNNSNPKNKVYNCCHLKFDPCLNSFFFVIFWKKKPPNRKAVNMSINKTKPLKMFLTFTWEKHHRDRGHGR